MRRVLWFTLLSVGVAAQTPGQSNLSPLMPELRTAIRNDSLAVAAELANRLDDAVQQRYNAWLIRDADQRVQEVLTWLPDDTESLWVNQTPFPIKPDDSAELLSERPIQLFCVDRLIALNEGNIYRALGRHTVRLVVAAAGQIRRGEFGGPPSLAVQDVAYFYFFADAVELPQPDESLQGKPVWHASAKVLSSFITEPGVAPAQREDENWIGLARPDLLIVAHRRELLAQILRQIAGGQRSHALPTDLPEWRQVDRSAPFWGLRHLAAQPQPAREQPPYVAQIPRLEGFATGATVRFDPVRQRLEIRYLTEAPMPPRGGGPDLLAREFDVDHPEPGVWRLISDLKTRGPWPLHVAMTMLGFVDYR
ncbi:MAG: hypothetical protein ABSF64_02490 [Bryobacteraceae bacterium]|jgi:hypothetical protein